jgi:hypothetical protein
MLNLAVLTCVLLADIKFQTRSGRPVIDGVFLNGHGPYRFLLDTGSAINQLGQELAKELGAAPSFQAGLTTVAGTIDHVGGVVDAVRLGPVVVRDQKFLFSTLDNVHILAPEIDGVLGEEFLATLDYLIDFANRCLILNAPSPQGGLRISLEMVENLPVIETSIGKLVLDSGTDTVILYGPVAKPDRQVQTSAGSAAVETVSGIHLSIAGHEYYRGIGVKTPVDFHRVDGDLPASLFKAIFVSNSGKYAILNPKG